MAANKFGNLEFKVGLFIIISIAMMVAILVTFAIKKKLFVPKINVSIYTDSGEGISKSMPVKYAGFTISRVYEVELMDDGKVVLHTRIPKQYTKWIREDSVAKLESQNIIGSNFIVFSGGTAAAKAITNEKQFTLVREGGLAEILKQAQPVIDDIKEIVSNVASITQTIDDQKQNVNSFFTGLADVGNDLHNKQGSAGYLIRSDYVKDEVQVILARIQTLQEELNEITKSVNNKVAKPDGTLDRVNDTLATLQETLNTAQATIDALEPSVNNVNQITGDVAEATDNLTEMKDQADSMLKTSDRMLHNLEHKWPFNSSVDIKGNKVKLP